MTNILPFTRHSIENWTWVYVCRTHVRGTPQGPGVLYLIIPSTAPWALLKSEDLSDADKGTKIRPKWLSQSVKQPGPKPCSPALFPVRPEGLPPGHHRLLFHGKLPLTLLCYMNYLVGTETSKLQGRGWQSLSSSGLLINEAALSSHSRVSDVGIQALQQGQQGR